MQTPCPKTEIALFNPRLEQVGRVRVPGVAVGVCFLERGLAALCANYGIDTN